MCLVDASVCTNVHLNERYGCDKCMAAHEPHLLTQLAGEYSASTGEIEDSQYHCPTTIRAHVTWERCPMSILHVEDIEVHADDLHLASASATYAEYGCLVVRGLFAEQAGALLADAEAAADTARSLFESAKQVPEGWTTPDGTLWIPAPSSFARDKQIMVLGLRYTTSAAFFHSAFNPRLLDLVEAILGADIELFLDGQCLYKEPVGGHPKHLHQDAAYFEHKFEGPIAALTYLVDTDIVNGALHVIPGSHRLGNIAHINTFSHLGLDGSDWPWERALPIPGRAGDTILFGVKTVHGSKENHSASPRPVIIHRYRRPNDHVVVSATNVAKRTEAEKRRSEVDASKQQGLMVRGRRRFEAGAP